MLKKFKGLLKKIGRVFINNGDLINNISANYCFSPVYFLIIFNYFSHVSEDLYFDPSAPFFGVIPACLLSTWFYAYCSTFFQPDLDARMRPGQGYFPIGKWAKKYSVTTTLLDLLRPVNRVWFYLFEPYARLFTHRGLTHWPILSVWIRVGYLYLCVKGFELFIRILMPNFRMYSPLMTWLHAFFPWNSEFGSAGFYMFCLPVYVSDFFHISVDHIDSLRKGLNFCPPKIPRGYLYRVVSSYRNSGS